MTDTTQLPESVLKRIEANAEKTFPVLHLTVNAPVNSRRNKRAFIMGAESEALRSFKLIQALKSLRYGLFKDANAVNELIDKTISDYNSLP